MGKETDGSFFKPVIKGTLPLSSIPKTLEKIGDDLGNDQFKSSGLIFKDKYIDSGYLRPEIICFIEYPYVDKVYRDTFYNFHAPKIEHHEKDCIRISFFDSSIDKKHFEDKTLHEACSAEFVFLGCITIRPTVLNPFGRIILSPRASTLNEKYLMLREFKFLINGSVLKVKAFPNSGQDGEYHSCAETSIMNVLRYFSKYDKFNSKLPSEIIKIIDKIRHNRVTPTEGLSQEEMSFILKKSGFGVKTYLKNKHDQKEFKQFLNDYVESGIPVIALVKNNSKVKRDERHHAVIAVGHENIVSSNAKIFSNPEKSLKTVLDSTEMYDKKYVFVDDNFPSYQLGSFNKPTNYYEGIFKDASIYAIIIPLDKRIYLDSARVRKIFKLVFEEKTHFLSQRMYLEDDNPYISRYCLTTSNALKKNLCGNKNLSREVKNIVEGLNLPRFTWIIELSEPENYKKGLVNGFVIIDSTGSTNLNSIIAVFWSNVINIRGNKEQEVPSKDGKLLYPMYINNLKKV